MTIQDLSTYSEVDTNSRISRTSTTETFSNLGYAETAYSYKDFTAGFFAGSQYFEGELNVSFGTSAGTLLFCYGNELGPFASATNLSGIVLQYTTALNTYVWNRNGGTDAYLQCGNLSTSTTYYYRVGILAGLGQYGAVFIEIYSDSGRTTLVTSGIVQRPAATNYRYFYPVQSNGSAGSGVLTGTNANITLYSVPTGLALTGFTEVDPSNRIASYADCATFTTLNTNETAYLYKDYTAGNISGDYTFRATLNVSAFASGSGQMLNLLSCVNTLGHANNTNDLQGIALNWISGSTYSLKAREVTGATEYLSSASSTLSTNTPYFIQVNRDTYVGTYGTLYVKVFSDPAFTTQVGSTVSLTLHDNGTPDKAAFQYLNVVQSYNTGANNSTTLSMGTVTATIATPDASTIAWTQADNTVAVAAFRATAASVAVTQADNTVAITAAKNSPVFQPVFTQDDNAVAAAVTFRSSSAVAVAQANNIVAVSTSTPVVTEQFSVRVRHKTTGAALTGLTTVALTICDPATGYRFDFSDSTFKASPTTPTKVLNEVSAVNQPGLYRCDVLTTVMNGWVEFEATYNDGSYTYSYPGEAFYYAGHRSTGAWTNAQQTQVTAIQSAVSATPAAVLAQFMASIIPANMVQIKGQALTGSGSAADPWGP